jgi:hypothetical protein
MSEVALDDAEIDAVFEQMGRVGVTQRMHRGLLANGTPLDGASQAGLETRARDGAPVVSQAVGEAMAGGGGKEPVARAVSLPVVPQQDESALCRRHSTGAGASSGRRT